MNASRPGVLALGLLLALMLFTACASTTSHSTAAHSSPEMSSASSTPRDNSEAPEERVPHVSTPASALTDLSTWLGSQHELRSFSRTELITGTWLLWLRHADDSTLCLEVSGEAFRCWREAGQVTRVVPYAWTHRSEPEGFLAVFRDRAGPVFWSLRTRPELQRAHARSQHFLAQARPSWWPSPYRIAPIGIIAIPQWHALAPAEAPELGPLRWLVVKSLHIQGQARVAERQDSIVVARVGERRVLCVRQAAWTCSQPLDVGDHTDSEYLDGFDVDGTSIALVRSVRSADVAGSGSAAAHLEFWERREALEFRGSVQVGRATWRPEEVARRRVERVLHSMHIESDLCLRIDDAETAHGPTDVDFNAVGESGVLNLTRAPQSIEFETRQAQHLLDLGGLWRVDATGLTRVNDCGSQPRTMLTQVPIPSDLEPRAAACLGLLNEAIDELPPMSIVEGNACGATHYRDGAILGRERFRYDGDRRVENVRVVRLPQDDDDRYVFRERFFWRGGRRIGDDYESVHFRAGEEECGHTQTRRDTLDREGRPTRVRRRIRPCEGDDRSVNERRRWRRGDGFDVGEYGNELHYFVPTYAAAAAEVACSERSCFCQMDVRDESGWVRMHLNSANLSARVEYLYDCPAMTWPESTEDLRQLSIETTFGDEG